MTCVDSRMIADLPFRRTRGSKSGDGQDCFPGQRRRQLLPETGHLPVREAVAPVSRRSSAERMARRRPGRWIAGCAWGAAALRDAASTCPRSHALANSRARRGRSSPGTANSNAGRARSAQWAPQLTLSRAGSAYSSDRVATEAPASDSWVARDVSRPTTGPSEA